MSKRRRARFRFEERPSESHVKRGVRVVHGGKLLEEKLGRNDLCPCGSGKRFKSCCLSKGCF
ncbi:MAG: SEC-C domain-containing protein [Planctomycetaceae bacterium]|nr:SEC-C domain-containing protein [Planctomycetaceae bacterium]